MSRTLSIRNRQRLRRVNTPLLRRITLDLLEARFGIADYELAIHLVGEREMARVNQDFLGHEGSTDVITFDHSEGAQGRLHGELYVCLDDAVKQARAFRSSWQSEVVRYVIHGLLHLCGHDDLEPARRYRMKREEGRLLRAAGRIYPIARLARAAVQNRQP